MSGSFARVNYRLRPAKGVERRMMAEAFLRLRPFGSVESYRYVGMGSVYFADFSVFHTICGFTNMVSIEDALDTTTQERFKLNVPLGTIDLRFGNTNVVLPTLNWDVRTVGWLDYDGTLTGAVLTDVNYLANKVTSGSLLAVTLNARLSEEEETSKGDSRLEKLIKQLGSKEKVPTQVLTTGSIKPSEIKSVFRTILAQEVSEGLMARNAGRPAEQRMAFEQIFFFEYNDSAPMVTLGWIFFDEGQRHHFHTCAFDTLKFIRSSDDSFRISVPFLTPQEMREIDRCNAANSFRSSDLPLPADDVERYNQVRRYWPVSANSEMT